MSVVVVPEAFFPAEVLPRLIGRDLQSRLFHSAIPLPKALFFSWVGWWLASFFLCSIHAAPSASAPAITSFSPASGSPGTLVIINGSNLFQVSTIRFNGISAPVYGSADDGTAVQTAVPTNAVTGPVSVTAATGTATSASDFLVIDLGPPIISSFAPSSGPPGTAVTISGSNLSGVTAVQFGGIDASFSTIQGLMAYVPTNAVTGPITLTTRQGFTSTDLPFTVTTLGPPVISSFSPSSGPVGTFVEFKGTNLTHVQSVSFNGTASQFVDYGSAAEPHPGAAVPAGATTGPITIVTSSGMFTTTQSFTVTTVPPVITAFTPATAAVGELVTLSGQNLTGIQKVLVSGVSAEVLPFLPTQIDIRVPYAPSGPITIVTDGGSFTTTSILVISNGAQPLGLSSVSPASGPPGAFVTLRVTNLFGTVQAISFNGVAADFLAYGPEIVAEVPALALSGPVTIQTTSGRAVSRSPFIVFRSAELASYVTCSRNPVLKGSSTLYSISVTNLSGARVENLVVTNSFAGGEPPSDSFVVWTNGQPTFVGTKTANLKIKSVHSSHGEAGVTNGMAVTAIGALAPAESALVQIEVEPQTAEPVYQLTSVTAVVPELGKVYSSFLSSIDVTDGLEMSIQQHSATEVEITWPIVDPPVFLETAPGLFPGATWMPAVNPVSVIDGHNSVTVDFSGSSLQIYRLNSSTR